MTRKRVNRFTHNQRTHRVLTRRQVVHLGTISQPMPHQIFSIRRRGFQSDKLHQATQFPIALIRRRDFRLDRVSQRTLPRIASIRTQGFPLDRAQPARTVSTRTPVSRSVQQPRIALIQTPDAQSAEALHARQAQPEKVFCTARHWRPQALELLCWQRAALPSLAADI